jgi:hypothetical protein
MPSSGFSLARNRGYGQGVTFPRAVANMFSLLGADTPGAHYFNARNRTMYSNAAAPSCSACSLFTRTLVSLPLWQQVLRPAAR